MTGGELVVAWSSCRRGSEVFTAKTTLSLAICCAALLLLPAASATGGAITTRDSVDSAGGQGNGESYNPVLSGDGRFVAFHSLSSNLVSGDTNANYDVFVRDRLTGQTTRVSVSSTGEQSGSGGSDPAISDDGRFVAFESGASNFDPADTNHLPDIYVRDRQLGVTERVSVSTSGEQGDWISEQPAISADGRYVAFLTASALVPDDTNFEEDIYVHDRQTGETTRVNLSSSGEQSNERSWRPALSADGRFVAFESAASNLVPGDTNAMWDVFVHDRQTGETTRASVDSNGAEPDRDSMFARLSADGRYVAFMTNARLVWDDTNIYSDVYIHDRETGQTTRASVDTDGLEGNADSVAPAISGDGRYVSFWSEASNLVPGDTNGQLDIFVRDRETHTT